MTTINSDDWPQKQERELIGICNVEAESAFYGVEVEPWNVIQLNFVFQSVKSTTQLQYAEKEWMNCRESAVLFPP